MSTLCLSSCLEDGITITYCTEDQHDIFKEILENVKIQVNVVQTVGVFDTDSDLTVQVDYRAPASCTTAQFM